MSHMSDWIGLNENGRCGSGTVLINLGLRVGSISVTRVSRRTLHIIPVASTAPWVCWVRIAAARLTLTL
jgi:hypothetical protein